jgi:CRP-like cAMP-binding protein
MLPESAEVFELVKNLHIFSRLSDEALYGLIEASTIATFKPGQTAIQEGEESEHFAIILDGQAEALQTSRGEVERLALLVTGDYFGEESFLSRQASLVTIAAVETLRILRIPVTVFDAFMHSHPQVRGALRLAYSSRKLLRHITLSWLRKAEVVYFIGQKSRFFLMRALVIPLLLACLAFGSLIVLYGAGVTTLLPFLGAGGIGGLAMIWMGWNALDWSNDHYLITNQRVVWLERIAGIYDSRQEAPLNTILSVGVKTSQTGRLLSYGHVEIRTYTGTITFHRVSHPDQVAALVEEHWFRSRHTHKKEEVQAMSQAIRQRLGRDLPDGDQPAITSEPPVVEPIVKPGPVTRAFSNLFRMRFEEGPVVTYRKHWFVLIRRTWKPFAWCMLAAVLAGARISGLIDILTQGTFLLVDGLFFTGVFLWYVYEYLDWHNDIYQVTPDQIIDLDKKPLGREEKRAAPLENILSIQYERLGIFGLIFNFGTVTINVGISQFTFDYVFNPLQVQKDLFNRLEERTAFKKQEALKAERERVSEWFATYDEITHPEVQPYKGTDDQGFENEPEDRQFWG